MKETTFLASTVIAAPQDEVYTWHSRPGAFQRLNPPWNPVTLTSPHPGLFNGAKVSIAVSIPVLRFFKIPWLLIHERCEPYNIFCDRQLRGPFRSWLHEHRFKQHTETSCLLEECIKFSTPLSSIINRDGLIDSFISKELKKLFSYRHRVTSEDLQRHQESSSLKRFLITGGSGMIGHQLQSFLQGGGHSVTLLSRDTTVSPNWNEIQSGALNLSEFDIIVHLAGENIANGRWSKKQKQKILLSRTQLTTQLAEAVSRLGDKAPLVISASAIGLYGTSVHRATEASPPGDGFLSEVSVAWEQAWENAERAGVKVAKLRFGTILSPVGGALKKMLLPFSLGIGGKIGNGAKRMSWIALDDALYAIHFISEKKLSGIFNLVAPTSITNTEMTKTIGSVLQRPTILPLPEFFLKLLFGEMASETILSDSCVVPERLTALGFRWSYPHLKEYLQFAVGRNT